MHNTLAGIRVALLFVLVNGCGTASHSREEDQRPDTDTDTGTEGGGTDSSTATDTPFDTPSDTDTSFPIERWDTEGIVKDMTDDEAATLFDRREVVEIRLTLPIDAWEQLIVDAEDEQYTHADVTIMGETLSDIGLRFKGAYGSLYPCFDEDGNLICDKLSMKIKFDEYVEDQQFMGLKRINLHAMKYDGTKMRDCLAYDMFRDMGIVSPRCAYAFVYVDDAVEGLYILVEQVDGRFTDSRFIEGNGNLYKEAWPESKYQSYYRNHLKTNDESATHEAFVAFSEAMLAAGDASLPAALSHSMNIDYLMRYMAVDYAIANWDGLTTFYCGAAWPCLNHNYYMYQEETIPHFWIIPWDLEATFVVDHWLGDIEPWDKLDVDCKDTYIAPGEDSYIRPAGCDKTMRALALADRARYGRALGELLETQLSDQVMAEKIDALSALIAPFVEADPDLDPDVWRGDIGWQLEELDRIRERVADAINAIGDIEIDTDTEKETDQSTDDSEEAITVVETLLLDDCRDDDITTPLRGTWLTYDDSSDGQGVSEVWPVSVFGNGVFEMSAPGYGNDGYASRMTGTTGDVLGWDNVGLFMSLGPSALCPDPQPIEADLSRYDGIRFMAKGHMSGGELWLMFPYGKDGSDDNCTINGVSPDTLTKWADYYVDIAGELTEDWTEVYVGFDELEQPSWIFNDADYIVDIDTVLAHLKGIAWQYVNSDGGEVDLWIDNIELYRTEAHVIESKDAGVDAGADAGMDAGQALGKPVS